MSKQISGFAAAHCGKPPAYRRADLKSLAATPPHSKRSLVETETGVRPSILRFSVLSLTIDVD